MTNNEIMIKMEKDIRLQGLSSQTREKYFDRARFFLNYVGNKNSEDCDEKDIRNFLMYLMKERNLSSSTVNVYNCSLRFLFGFTMERNLNYRRIPLLRIVRKLPGSITKEQIEILFDACNNVRDKAIPMTIYGGGLRLSDCFIVHTLRHNFAIHLPQAGTDVCQIKKLLGHTHIQSTAFYLPLLEFDDSLVSPWIP